MLNLSELILIEICPLYLLMSVRYITCDSSQADKWASLTLRANTGVLYLSSPGQPGNCYLQIVPEGLLTALRETQAVAG